jgi:signal transduction histidine kinase
MYSIRIGLSVALIVSFGAISAFADNETDVLNLVNSAAGFVQEKGPDYAVKAFNAIHGPYIKGNLYIFAGTMDGRIVAHPYSKKLLEGMHLDLKDVKGKEFFREFMEMAKTSGAGWVEYWWPQPGTQEIALKRSYIKRVPNQDMWVGAGYYVP